MGPPNPVARVGHGPGLVFVFTFWVFGLADMPRWVCVFNLRVFVPVGMLQSVQEPRGA